MTAMLAEPRLNAGLVANDRAEALILTGTTGVGKSGLACAIGFQACRDNRSVFYARVPRLSADLAAAHVDGRYLRLMRSLGGVNC